METQPLANLKLALPPGAEVFLNGKRVNLYSETALVLYQTNLPKKGIWSGRCRPTGHCGLDLEAAPPILASKSAAGAQVEAVRAPVPNDEGGAV